MQLFAFINLRQLLIVALIAISACTYDTLEEQEENLDPCARTDISYSQDIAPVLELSCNSCHNQGFSSGGVAVDDYDAVKSVIDRGRLIGTLKHQGGFSPMPRGAPMLDQCTIALFEQWVAEGTQNN